MKDLVAKEYTGSDFSFVLKKATPFVLRSPIATPVQTSFGIMTDRPAVFLVLEDSEGNKGIGEIWCNFPSCGAEHRARLLNTVILPTLIGEAFVDPCQCYNKLQTQFQRLAIQTGEFGPLAQSIAGIDIALWDLVANRLKVPLYRLFGGSDSSIGVYASGINPKGAVEMFKRCRDAGYNAFKLKIGFGDAIDYPNIECLCAELKSNQVLMVDANQAWTLEEAIAQTKKLADYPIKWLEEPMMADTPVEHWNVLAQASSIPIAAGENMADTQSFMQASESNWLSVMQPDVCKWGGFSAVVPVVRHAVRNAKRFCPHFLGGGVGLAASAHVLASIGGDGLLEIDSNPNPLREDIYSPTVKDGCIDVEDKPGLGIDLDLLMELVNNHACSVITT